MSRSNYYAIIRLCRPGLLSEGSNARHYLPSTWNMSDISKREDDVCGEGRASRTSEELL